MAKKKYKLTYPEFVARNYGVAIPENYQRKNKPFIDPSSFALARWFLNSPAQKEQMVRRWIEEVNNPEKGYTQIFTFDKKVLVDIGDKRNDGSPKKTKKNPLELTVNQLLEECRARTFKQYGSYNMFDLSFTDIFFLNDGDKKSIQPVTKEGVVLSGSLKRKSGGRTERAYDRVRIKGPFERSRILLADISSYDKDHEMASMKQGYTNVQLVSTTVAALLYLASRNPKAVKGLKSLQKKWKGAKVWLPFDFLTPQSIPKGLYSIKKGKQPSLDCLVVDAVIDKFFNNSSKYEIGKKISRSAVIMNRKLWSMIYEGAAGFEVLAQKYVIGKSEPLDKDLREWIIAYKGYLKRNGFKEVGNVVEKKGSQHEVKPVRFVNEKREERRIIFSREYPPVVIKRKPRKNAEVDVFYDEKRTEPMKYVHPFAELFQPKPMFDDCRRILTNYQVVIPTEVYLPNSMISDYHTAIQEFYPGGSASFIRKVHQVHRKEAIQNISKLKIIAAQRNK